jgi:hypothetical protein
MCTVTSVTNVSQKRITQTNIQTFPSSPFSCAVVNGSTHHHVSGLVGRGHHSAIALYVVLNTNSFPI